MHACTRPSRAARARAQGALLHYLRRIDTVDQQLRVLHAPTTQRVRVGSLDRPAPWHEPHG